MHSYLRTVGFSKVKSRKEMQEIIQDVINTYDEKIAVENHPDGVFVQYSKNYGCDCGITVCGQYDEDNEFHVEYSFPFFRGTGITSQESVVVERHAEKESYAGACDDMRLGVTLIFYLQNPAEYMLEKYKGNVREGQPDAGSLLMVRGYSGCQQSELFSGSGRFLKKYLIKKR